MLAVTNSDANTFFVANKKISPSGFSWMYKITRIISGNLGENLELEKNKIIPKIVAVQKCHANRTYLKICNTLAVPFSSENSTWAIAPLISVN